MYSLKSQPEDFVVEEATTETIEAQGPFSLFLLQKNSLTTESAIQALCQKTGIPRKHIGYAGIKDKQAVTTQYISILNGRKTLQDLVFHNFSLKHVGYAAEPISLGDLKANHFIIVVRNLTQQDLKRFQKHLQQLKKQKYKMPNFYDEQRFSHNNAAIGKALLQQKYKEAVQLLLKNTQYTYEANVKEYIDLHPNQYVQALQHIPKKILLLYIHAYQSQVFNDLLKHVQQEKKMPLVGYGTQLKKYPDKTQQQILQHLQHDQLTLRSFIIRSFPELSSYGSERATSMTVEAFSYEEGSDELHKGKKKITLTFSLGRGSYATIVVKWLFAQAER